MVKALIEEAGKIGAKNIYAEARRIQGELEMEGTETEIRQNIMTKRQWIRAIRKRIENTAAISLKFISHVGLALTVSKILTLQIVYLEKVGHVHWV